MSDIPKNPQDMVRVSPYFKLKRKAGKHFMAIHLKESFGFLPETIIIERDLSRSNVIRINAILTAEELKKVLDSKKATKEVSKDDSTNPKPATT